MVYGAIIEPGAVHVTLSGSSSSGKVEVSDLHRGKSILLLYLNCRSQTIIDVAFNNNCY